MTSTPFEKEPDLSSESEINLKIAPDLTDAERASVDRLLRLAELQEQIPPEQRIPITNPEKYSFPIGMDDEGNLFPNRSTQAE
jgi:hypothetical protein